jgi:hypothetical protein
VTRGNGYHKESEIRKSKLEIRNLPSKLVTDGWIYGGAKSPGLLKTMQRTSDSGH